MKKTFLFILTLFVTFIACSLVANAAEYEYVQGSYPNGIKLYCTPYVNNKHSCKLVSTKKITDTILVGLLNIDIDPNTLVDGSAISSMDMDLVMDSALLSQYRSLAKEAGGLTDDEARSVYFATLNFTYNQSDPVDGQYTLLEFEETKIGSSEERCLHIISLLRSPDKHYCEKYNNEYYDSQGNKVNESNYYKDCFSCQTATESTDGKYHDKNGLVTDKAGYEAACLPPEEPPVTPPEEPPVTPPEEPHYCTVYSNEYYNKKGEVVTKEEYLKDCYSCVPADKADDKEYHDNNGLIVTKEEYEDACIPKVCKIVTKDDKTIYYGKDGNEVTEDVYKKECTKGPKCGTGTDENGNTIYYDANGNIVTLEEWNRPLDEGGCSTGSFIPYIGIISGIALIAGAFVISKKKGILFKL